MAVKAGMYWPKVPSLVSKYVRAVTDSLEVAGVVTATEPPPELTPNVGAEDVVEGAHFTGGEGEHRHVDGGGQRALRGEGERGVLRGGGGVVDAHVGAPAVAAACVEGGDAGDDVLW